MIRTVFTGLAALCLGSAAAKAATVGFYVEDSMPVYTETVFVTDNSAFPGPGTVDVTKRYAEVTSFSVPQFDASLGSLTRVDVYFGVDGLTSDQNFVSVALDGSCDPCEKDLSAEVTFGFGLDLFVGDYSGGGAISQFFDISVQSLFDFGSFDNDPGALFPSAGEVTLDTATVNGDYDVLGLTDAASLAAFTGNGDIFFDVGPAIALALSLACRDSIGDEVTCTEDVGISAGGGNWAMQVVYTYTPVFDPDLTSPSDPGRVYDGVSGLQILPPGSDENDLRFFTDNRGFTPTVIPVPVPAILLISGLGALAAFRRSSQTVAG